MELAEESTSERQTENRFKLVLLGSADVGKSSLVLRYTRDDFMETVSTTGCAFFSHRVYLQGRMLDFEVWDTAGQERYHSVSHLYYRGASAALLVYDITSKESFSRAQLWFQELQKYVFSGEMVIALVGNKSDLQDKGKVSREVAQAFAEQKGLLFIETSAKTGDGVKEVFEAVAHELLALEKQKEEKQRRRDSLITLEESRSSDVRHRCCNFH
ncbi:ras-related protein Rab-17 isoform X1 [Bufo gargarizans]|uniref:ras-related protein Rab-17 isoform X1 n=1 Tax=Bufo gargarizans TaxID=30331 RepID=UPI001CF41C65|nr:ras-related protein Rab-17 isoform X1 [Bufo gargarizans]